jgi:hypothetical protein
MAAWLALAFVLGGAFGMAHARGDLRRLIASRRQHRDVQTPAAANARAP